MKRIVTFSQHISPQRKQGPCWGGSFIKRRSFLWLAKAFRGRDQCGQATKGVWGMSWRQEAMKGVENCDKPGGLVKRELIPGSLNNHVLNP